ncbi:MAG TPA: hypothetical protein VIC71_08630 [Gammaproteobacteria bacterium]
MKILANVLIVVLGYIPVAALAACERPSTIAVPDGATATFEEMSAAQSDVKVYMAAMESYLACINEELEVGGDDAPMEFKSALTATHSSAVVEVETLAAAFIRELQAFSRAHPEQRQTAPLTRTR